MSKLTRTYLNRFGRYPFIWFFCLIFIFTGNIISQDYEPVDCKSAESYEGQPLHEELSSDFWDHMIGDLKGQVDSELKSSLDNIAEKLLELTESPAISAAVGIPGKGIWSISKGMALIDPPTPIDSVSYFHWASVGKAFTATAIMQLAGEQKLDYNDPLAKWIPDFPNADVITVDHLLLHTSGTFSFNRDLPFREERGYKPPEELLKIAMRHGNAFCPGKYWAYSNTNYVLLALILEEIEKKPFHQILTERIIIPLNLKNTIALMPEQKPRGLVKGHTKDGPDEQYNESLPFGAGIIVSSAKDMVLFWHGFLTGTLINRESVRDAFANLYPMNDKELFYGRGVMLYDVKNENSDRVVWWLGHSGGTQGIKTIVAYDMLSKIYVAVALNNFASAEASANKLITETKRLIK